VLESFDEPQSTTTNSNHSDSSVSVRIGSEEGPSASFSLANGASISSWNPISSSRKFGILDFLPKFPKRDKDVKVSEEKLLSQALTSSYICEAAGHFAVAQDSESNGDYEQAFTSYKEGIRILLAGAKSNPK